MENYLLAWMVYLLGCAGLGVSLWLLCRRWRRPYRHFVMATFWVLLLTPFAVDSEAFTLAPALFIVTLNFMFHGSENAAEAGVVLLAFWLVAQLLSLVWQLLVRPRHTHHPDSEGMAFYGPDSASRSR